jgi:hypothetical protein
VCDNCPAVSNADQTDTDGNTVGDVCDGSQFTILDGPNGNVLFDTRVPTVNTYAYAAADMGAGPGTGRTVRFTPSSFPPGQRLVLYDFYYGTGSGDQGGSEAVSDVLSGNWICMNTGYKSLQAPAGQTVTVNDAWPLHAVRYVDGTCHVNIPFQPIFHELEHEIVSQIEARLPGIVSLDYFEFAQPHFRSRGSLMDMGFMFEAMYKFSVGATLATVSLDPAFSIGLRQADGLFTLKNIARNVTTLGLASSAKPEIDAVLQNMAPIENLINQSLSPLVSQFVSAIGLPAGSVTTSCVTPTPGMPSPECFGNVNTAITNFLSGVGTPPQLVTLATQILTPTNFTCDPTLQCRFHPVFQGVNILPDNLEIVLAPDLRNPTNPLNPLITQFFSLLGPVSISETIQLGHGPITVSLTCDVPPVTTKSGSITTVLTDGGDGLDLASGILCGGIAEP